MASTYIKRDLSVSETIYKWTWSAWVKRSGSFNSVNTLFKSRQDGNNWVQVYFGDGGHADELLVAGYKNGGYHYAYSTSRKFRDVNAWYHIVVNVDSSQSTAGDRVRIYVNGERETSFATSTNNLSNGDSLIFNTSDSGTGHTIGSWNTTAYFNGLMSHVHYSSGYSYAPTVFGSVDNDTGEWKINTAPTFTLGGNGYTVLKDGNTITDQSSNSNDFTLGGGTLSKTEDCPSNNFATFMPLVPRIVSGSPVHPTFSNGSTTAYFDNANYNENAVGSIAMKGKIYFEVKCTSINADGSGYVGMVDLSGYDNGFIGNKCIAYRDNGEKINIGTSTSYGNTWTAGDIISVAFDSATGTIWFSKNGTWQNSATITEIANGTTTNSAFTGLSGDFLPLVANYSDKYASVNFGNGYFGTTAVSSNSGNGYSGTGSLGIFQYQPPTGYTALCTKGLNE